jgi:predicted ATPase with chaperone activity
MSIEDTGLGRKFLVDLLLKAFHVHGTVNVSGAARVTKLSRGVLQDVFEIAKEQMLIEARGHCALGGGEINYALTDKGRVWAVEALSQSQYAGPAPVTFADYCAQVERQGLAAERADRSQLESMLQDMVLPGEFVRRLGPALNSSKSILLYGPPGNGKTTVAEKIGHLFSGVIAIPYAIEIDGQVIKVFDPSIHEPVEDATDTRDPHYKDSRWVMCRRPSVIAGCELSLEMVELRYSGEAGLYEAPLQMKAMGGVFIIDDLGRQLVRAEDLLNRWITPMDKQVDYLSLVTGKKFEVPFDNLLIFSTNLTPNDLMDAAFLRRLPYKLEVRYPTVEEYAETFKRAASPYPIQITAEAVHYVIDALQQRHGHPISFYQPKFIIDQVFNSCRFDGVDPVFSEDRLRDAIDNLVAETTPHE